jgi:hypothetical protein
MCSKNKSAVKLGSNAKKLSPKQGELFCAACASRRRRRVVPVLLWRGRRETFASLGRFRLWFGFRRLLHFFSAFVFASHKCKCATKGLPEESQKAVVAQKTPAMLNSVGWV